MSNWFLPERDALDMLGVSSFAPGFAKEMPDQDVVVVHWCRPVSRAALQFIVSAPWRLPEKRMWIVSRSGFTSNADALALTVPWLHLVAVSSGCPTAPPQTPANR